LSLNFASIDDALRAKPLIADLGNTPANLDGSILEITVNNGPAVTADALRRIDGAGIGLSGLALREPSLDDVFLNLTGHKAEDEPADTPEVRGRNRKARA
jgi:ABC-2 type transport system ATP-binding protein